MLFIGKICPKNRKSWFTSRESWQRNGIDQFHEKFRFLLCSKSLEMFERCIQSGFEWLVIVSMNYWKINAPWNCFGSLWTTVDGCCHRIWGVFVKSCLKSASLQIYCYKYVCAIFCALNCLFYVVNSFMLSSFFPI